MKDLIDRVDFLGLGDMIDDLFRPAYMEKKAMQMKTDIKETPEAYELDIDLPGYKKDEIDVTLRDGYLTVSAKKAFLNGKPQDCGCDDDCECGCKDGEECKCEEKEEKHPHHEKLLHKFIRRERFYSAARSYYVGTKVQQDEIKAKYEDGVLTLVVPKEKPKEVASQKINID